MRYQKTTQSKTKKPTQMGQAQRVRERVLGKQSQMNLPPSLKGYNYSIEHGLKKPRKAKMSTVRIVSVASTIAVLPFVWWLSNSNAFVVDNIQASQPIVSVAETAAPNNIDTAKALAEMETIVPAAPNPVVIAEPIKPVVTPEVQPVAVIEKQEPPAFEPWIDIKVQSGDTLSAIFSRYELSKAHLYQIAKVDKKLAKKLRQLRLNQKIRVKRDEQGNVEEFVLDLGFATEFRVYQAENGFKAEQVKSEVTTEIKTAYGQVNSTLFNAGFEAGLPDSVMSQILEIFRWDEDFHLFQKGDHFTVVYEKYISGSESQFGEILAVEVFNNKATHRAIRYTDSEGETAYYHPEGQPLFAQAKRGVKKLNRLMSPVKATRISSKYGMRIHPISGKRRFHSGVDYAAPTGTPIVAAADSTVKFKGWKRGYGRTVVLQHNEQYTSLHAHMSKFANVKVGQKLKQGDIIGYIGQSGSATGPHLHYEVRLNNQPQNPLTFQIPNKAYEKQLAELKKQEALRKQHFVENTKDLRERLAVASQKTHEALGIQHASTLAQAAGVKK
ncbi:peptidoglycan DD-metalloendopeptidase family protein [Candidatus Albibeggiatoa sp. nov. NOAA]|uniref:M23 family metallopeptidase n=1 Tax=Candidatus Albibeggiatoa sp. nov. NOAA TaxID=3162724 RepID=UPI0032FFF621|nr:peptidoglycan DD-metalloendopeptidase family protein [Thiotrichaceae bacterium]